MNDILVYVGLVACGVGILALNYRLSQLREELKDTQRWLEKLNYRVTLSDAQPLVYTAGDDDEDREDAPDA